jgi:hypothetical protein
MMEKPSQIATALRQQVVFWDRQSTAQTNDVFELEISVIEFPLLTYFLEHVFDVETRRATSQVIAASRDHIRVSDDAGLTWRAIALPERGQYFKCFTTLSGRHLLQREHGGDVHLFDPEWSYLGPRKAARHSWHGSWSIDQSRAGRIMFAECGEEGDVMRVMSSDDDGESWQVAFEALSETAGPKPDTIRHFHTCQADPFETGTWWVSSGDLYAQNRIWCSKDNGRSWQQLSRQPQPAPLSRIPAWRHEHAKRHTAEIFSEQWIYWATDDNLSSCARLVRTPRSLENGSIEVLATLSRNEARNLIALGADAFAVISEAKHHLSHAQLFCVDVTGTSLARFEIPNVGLQRSGFCRSRSSRADFDGTFFSYSDGIMVRSGTHFLKWQLRRTTHADTERDRLTLLQRTQDLARLHGKNDPEATRLKERYAAHFQCNLCEERLDPIFNDASHGVYAGLLDPNRFWDRRFVEYPCPHCNSRARTRTGKVLLATQIRNQAGSALLVSEYRSDVRRFQRQFERVTNVALHGDFDDPDLVKDTDITYMPHIASESFNLYWAACVLDYVPDLEGVAREAFRVLLPGGEMAFQIMPYRLVEDATTCIITHRNALAHETYAQTGGPETGIPDCLFGVGHVLATFKNAGLAIRRHFVFDQMSRTSQSWFVAQKPGEPAAPVSVPVPSSG